MADKYTRTFRDTPCEACGANDGTTVPAHLNLNRGGMGLKLRGAVAGLCFRCHNIADGRENVPEAERWRVWARVCQKVLLERFREWEKGQ